MSTHRPRDEDETKKIEDEVAAPKDSEDDVEGHQFGGLTHPLTSWELAKVREREIAHEAARHPLIAEAKIRARRKG
jgi:hypothetical protein